MRFKKSAISSFSKTKDIVLALIFFVGFLSLIFHNIILFTIVGLLIAYLAVGYVYDRSIGNNLIINVKHNKIRMFNDEKTTIELIVENHSWLPLLNGELTIEIDDVIVTDENKISQKESVNVYSIPFSISSRGQVNIVVPIYAKKRGVAKLRNVAYNFPHLFDYTEVYLHLPGHLDVEVIVYPELKAVNGVDEQSIRTIGNYHSIVSPFEDMLSPVGTRDYIHSDPFNRIHWKGSARMQTLQTKVFERNWELTWTFIVNLEERTRLGNSLFSPHVEEIISRVAYLCHYATKQGIPFDMYINVRGLSRPVLYLEESEGREHLRSALELLSRVNHSLLLTPYSSLLYRVDQDFYKPRCIMLFGAENNESNPYIYKWMNKGARVTKIDIFNQENDVEEQSGGSMVANR